MIIVNSEQIIEFNPILRYLPKRLRKYLSFISLSEVEEIRLRKGLKLTVLKNSKTYYVTDKGRLSECFENAITVTSQDIEQALEIICESSLYAVENSIKNGFITLSGGHRVGLSGNAVITDGKISTIKTISSMNYRLSREIYGISNDLIKYIYDGQKVLNTLIISPPGCGKTTLLRDIAKNLSDRNLRVSVADERNEISAMHNGYLGYDLGNSCDVLEGMEKSEAMLMLLRTMSPEIIITDELGNKSDFLSCVKAMNSGVKVIASIHSDCKENVKKINEELYNKFECFITLSHKNGPGTIEEVYNVF